MAYRNNNTPGNRNNNLGFRLANTGKLPGTAVSTDAAGVATFCPAICPAPDPSGRIFIHTARLVAPGFRGEGRAVFPSQFRIYAIFKNVYIQPVATHRRYACIYTLYMLRYI